MAGINYNNIKQELKTIIDANSFTYDTVCGIEGNILQESFEPYINIELESRNDSPSQAIAANSRQRYFVTLVLTVSAKNFDKSQSALVRDAILSELEVLLMQNRTINGTVKTLWLTGGNNISGYVEDLNSYVSAADLRVNLDCIISL